MPLPHCSNVMILSKLLTFVQKRQEYLVQRKRNIHTTMIGTGRMALGTRLFTGGNPVTLLGRDLEEVADDVPSNKLLRAKCPLRVC
jgi:hypothetical protein